MAQPFKEKIIGSLEDDVCYGAVQLGSNVFYAMHPAMDYFGGATASGVIYKASEELVVKDSIVVSSALGLPFKSTVNRMERDSDSSFRCFSDGINGIYHVSTFDTNLRLLSSFPVSISQDTAVRTLGCAQRFNGKYFIGGTVITDTSRPYRYSPGLFKVDAVSGIVENRLVFDTIFGTGVSSITLFNNHLLVGFEKAGDTNAFLGITEGLVLDSVYSLRPVIQGFPRINMLMCPSTDGNSLMSFGFERQPSVISLIRFDSQLKPVKRDTFNLPSGSFFVGNDNFAVNDSGDFFVALTMDPVGYSSEFAPNLNRPIVVKKIREDGTALWSRQLVDSNFRLVSQIIPASSGGVFVVSVLYAPSTYAQRLTDVSILYLDAQGNPSYVGEAELPMNESTFHIFPNPANSYIQISGLTPHVSYSYAVFNMGGAKVYSGQFYGNSRIELPHLSSGEYLLYLVDNKGEAMSRLLTIE